MPAKDCAGSLHKEAIHGLELFNAGDYFEAHEALEAAWRDESGPVRQLYQGILQAAVVYLHITRGNYAGATKVYTRSRRWLERWPDTCRGVDVASLRHDLASVMDTVQKLGPDHIRDFEISRLKPVTYER